MAPRKRKEEIPTVLRTPPRGPERFDWREISSYELVFEDRFAYESRGRNCCCNPRTPPRSKRTRQDDVIGTEAAETRSPSPLPQASESPDIPIPMPGVPSARESTTEAFPNGGAPSPSSDTILPQTPEETPFHPVEVTMGPGRQESHTSISHGPVPAVKSSTPLPGIFPLLWPEASISTVPSSMADSSRLIPEEDPSGCPSHRHVTLFERSFLRRLPRAPRCGSASDPSTLTTILCLSSSPTSAREPIDHLLSLCGQQSMTTFEEALRISEARECTKLGEGSYGEVYCICHHGGEASAIKVVPVEGSVPYNGDDQMTLRDVLPEVVTSRELSNLRHGTKNKCMNFVELKKVHCIRDKYHPALLRAWLDYNDQRGSENDNPDMLTDDQLYVALEYADSGEELEGYKVASPAVACGIVLQIACALAVAECELRFEHRDLHDSNVLVAPFINTHVEFLVEGQTIRVPSHGILVTLIDYTMSRMQKGNGVIYMDLAKGDFFCGEGHHQFDMYRAMRERTGNVWRRFVPSTNALWLHHLSSQLLRRKYGKGLHGDRRYRLLRKWSAALAKEESAAEFVRKCGAGRPSLFA